MSMVRYYRINGQPVTATEYAEYLSDLLSAGYRLVPPPPTETSPAASAGRFWFAVWECSCSDVKGSPEALPPRCPCHDAAAVGLPTEVTAGVSTGLGHICASCPSAAAAGAEE